jgi:hypothetical protein
MDDKINTSGGENIVHNLNTIGGEFASQHVEAATPVLKLTTSLVFILSIIIVISGIGISVWANVWYVGITSIILAIVIMVYYTRNISSNLYKLAALPDDRPSQTSHTTNVDTGGGTYVGGNVASGRDFIGRDVTDKRDEG